MARRLHPDPQLWPIQAALASAAMLAIAHAFESFGGYQPCLLCLRQRDIYWAALAVGLFASAPAQWNLRWARVACVGLAGLFVGGMVVAAFHAGVEWKWWPGPLSCSGPRGPVSAGAMTDLLNGARLRPPSCDEAQWRMLGVSMAGYNALISAGLAVASSWAAFLSKPREASTLGPRRGAREVG